MPDHILTRFGSKDSGSPGTSLMQEAIGRFDWAATPAGPIAQWPDPLKHAARLVLLATEPMALLIGKDGLVAYNDAISDLFGARYVGSLGRPVGEVFPDADAFSRTVIDQCFAGIASRFTDQPLRVHRDGAWKTAWFHFAFTPIADMDGTVSGVFVVANETTARVKALYDLQRSRERIEIALDAGGIVGTWDWDVATDRMTCDERFARLFGMSAQEASGISSGALVGHVHLDDRAGVRDALAQAARTGEDYKCRYRIKAVNGELRWVFDAGRAVRDESGAIVKLCGVVIDLTSQIAAEDALADSERRFRGLVEAIPQIVWSTDSEARHDYFNSRWSEFTGIDAASVDGTIWERLVHPEDWPRVAEQWQECVATGQPYDIEYRFLHHSGRYRWLRVMALPVRGADGAIVRWYGTSTDIEEKKTLEMERELVANELEHRIRNLFALVNGLVMLSVRENAAFAPFADHLQRRLSALHEAHAFIRAREPVLERAPSIQALVRTVLAPYDDNGRIAVHGDNAVLQSHLVTPLALIFHELATNSAKYGALACEGGSLSLHFRYAGGRMTLTWVEAGSTLAVIQPGAQEIAGSGFGSKLLALTIERQLKGSFSRAFTPAGFYFEMDIPV